MKFHQIKSMYKHLKEDHSWPCETELRTFNSLSEFTKWKEEEDKDHYMNMYKITGKKANGESEHHYYVCNFNRTEPQWEQDNTVKGI